MRSSFRGIGRGIGGQYLLRGEARAEKGVEQLDSKGVDRLNSKGVDQPRTSLMVHTVFKANYISNTLLKSFSFKDTSF